MDDNRTLATVPGRFWKQPLQRFVFSLLSNCIEMVWCLCFQETHCKVRPFCSLYWSPEESKLDASKLVRLSHSFLHFYSQQARFGTCVSYIFGCSNSCLSPKFTPIKVGLTLLCFINHVIHGMISFTVGQL